MHAFKDPKTKLWHITRGGLLAKPGEIPYLGGTYGLAACGENVFAPTERDQVDQNSADVCSKCVETL